MNTPSRWTYPGVALSLFLASFSLDAIVVAADPAASPAEENPAMPGFQKDASDARAMEIADEVMRAMGGRPAWDNTHYVRWLFFGRRMHYWNKWTGDVRIEAGDKLVLMNIQTRKGRVWEKGVEVTQPESLQTRLEKGFAWWTNDSYWVFMPYKLKDSGVRLRYLGERAMQDGKPADVLELTFTGVGLTPENKYDIFVDKQTRLVSEWSYYEKAGDGEPKFTMPWKAWRKVGDIMLAGDHGRSEPDWKLAAFSTLPASVFTSPDSVKVQ
ncbi:MAG TPA: hypothetical protein VFE28_02435 [Candidatus Krumholzibacteria bacterium]|jgi:hypothetical protein|nr:hypothetical protein [Candidatus Krumholzibacteria bacterium]